MVIIVLQLEVGIDYDNTHIIAVYGLEFGG